MNILKLRRGQKHIEVPNELSLLKLPKDCHWEAFSEGNDILVAVVRIKADGRIKHCAFIYNGEPMELEPILHNLGCTITDTFAIRRNIINE